MLAAGSGGDGGHSDYEPEAANLDDLSDLAVAAHRGIPPSVLAAMLEEADQTGEASVDTFLDGLSELYHHASPEAGVHVESMNPLDSSINDAWRGFRGFMEALFFLERPAQLDILEAILSDTSTWGGLLVDQLSGAEFADFYGDLSEISREALAAYAAVVSSEQGRPVDEVISTLPSQSEVSSAKRVVASRISEVLRKSTQEHVVVEELSSRFGRRSKPSPMRPSKSRCYVR